MRLAFVGGSEERGEGTRDQRIIFPLVSNLILSVQTRTHANPVYRYRMQVSNGHLKSEEEYQHLEDAWDILREYRDDKDKGSNKLSTENLTALLRWAAPYLQNLEAECTSKQDMLRKYWEHIYDIRMMEDEVSTEGW